MTGIHEKKAHRADELAASFDSSSFDHVEVGQPPYRATEIPSCDWIKIKNPTYSQAKGRGEMFDELHGLTAMLLAKRVCSGDVGADSTPNPDKRAIDVACGGAHSGRR